jgi:hypothetical protein
MCPGPLGRLCRMISCLALRARMLGIVAGVRCKADCRPWKRNAGRCGAVTWHTPPHPQSLTRSRTAHTHVHTRLPLLAAARNARRYMAHGRGAPCASSLPASPFAGVGPRAGGGSRSSAPCRALSFPGFAECSGRRRRVGCGWTCGPVAPLHVARGAHVPVRVGVHPRSPPCSARRCWPGTRPSALRLRTPQRSTARCGRGSQKPRCGAATPPVRRSVCVWGGGDGQQSRALPLVRRGVRASTHTPILPEAETPPLVVAACRGCVPWLRALVCASQLALEQSWLLWL